MADYISREAVVSQIFDKVWTKTDEDGYIWVLRRDVIHVLEDIPAADVRPVVRCKDCIHAPLPGDCEGNDMEWPKLDGIYEDCTCPHCCGDNWYSTRPDPDGFCEKGERRESNLDTTKGERRDESSG